MLTLMVGGQPSSSTTEATWLLFSKSDLGETCDLFFVKVSVYALDVAVAPRLL
jgi:hypothetical protein